MKLFVGNQMTDGMKEAEVTIDKDVLTVKLLHEDLWFKCIVPDELVSFLTLFEPGDSLGLNQWYVSESNHEIKQSDSVRKRLWAIQEMQKQGIDVSTLNQDTGLKIKSSYEEAL